MIESRLYKHTFNLYRTYLSKFLKTYTVPGGKVNILGGHSISHSKQRKKLYMYMWTIPNGFRDRDISLHCTLEQHAMSSHELQSALMLTVEFSKMYYTR
jgi:hypothetical protein